MQGKLITVFGGGGFLGRYVAQALLGQGARLRIVGRNANSANHIKPLGNLGQVQLMAADIRKPASVQRAVMDADAVVNLVGSFADMDAVQNIGAGIVAQAAADAGVGALVHISAIGADAQSDAEYGQSKAGGEAAVHAAFPAAVILRPSIVFGREDQFINRFAGLIRMLPVVPVIGAATKFQPVFAGDVAKAVAAALVHQDGRVLELGGPEIFSMMELNRWIAKAIGRDPLFIEVPDIAAKMLAKGTGWMPGAPITDDQFKMLGHDNVVTGTDGLAAYGIVPTPLDVIADDWLNIYRKHGRFGSSPTA
ncbi:MAG: complex I NDUFA9 subunit family protein [Sphingorhabdus sp.]|uniref:complex I NDUFA9 subunit family protein n=1 Tax=Sphingorhabdus sp. TaxID=1902408 RepID=UPI0025E1B75A|nr:complex I NDUFA9 subunit family protein [Sphingorhabdus sp.]MCO4090577.1 complex I NDUFA9 subunit family protein [Sphingorhabdus sp.]